MSLNEAWKGTKAGMSSVSLFSMLFLLFHDPLLNITECNYWIRDHTLYY